MLGSPYGIAGEGDLGGGEGEGLGGEMMLRGEDTGGAWFAVWGNSPRGISLLCSYVALNTEGLAQNCINSRLVCSTVSGFSGIDCAERPKFGSMP